ncbi:MAG: hypothetical protein JXB39_11585 [Deltaproteobacteria bacterium]|nr:hypothetical protein [Deltaproteobacteria bacterium]
MIALAAALLALSIPAAAAPPMIPRDVFNATAAAMDVDLVWEKDADGDGYPSPEEMVRLGWASRPDLTMADVNGARNAVVRSLRLGAVRRELAQGRPTLIHTDLRALPEAEKAFARHVLAAADLMEALYRLQAGVTEPPPSNLDPASRALFERNQGPWCVAPQTEADPFCNALPALPPQRWGMWPEDRPHDQALCEAVRARPDAARLTDPFVAVRIVNGAFTPVPVRDLWGSQMDAIAEELDAAATALDRTREKALQKYLRAAADGFRTGTWDAADEAWMGMDSRNTRWYLRVAPDEVYWDLCQEKAGFGLTLGLVDPRYLAWNKRLEPLKHAMEKAIAQVVGPPYEARRIAFRMPEFLQVVRYAGEARSPLGATLGQTLPNWGAVADANRNRTMVMTNIRSDPDSVREYEAKAALLLVPEALAFLPRPEDPDLDTLLHEAAHNLGPSGDLVVNGTRVEDLLGGSLASTMDELWAQTGALWLIEYLVGKGVLTHEDALRYWTGGVLWAFRHISGGMTTPSGVPKTYARIAAVQVGFLVDAGALSWVETPDPATGRRVGRFALDPDRFPTAVEALLAATGRALARGDAEACQALVDRYVTGPQAASVHMAEIQERLRPFPDIHLVYAIDL